MVINLNLNFKTNILSNNSYKECNFKEHNVNLIVGLNHEADLILHIDSHILKMLQNYDSAKYNESIDIFDLSYTFDEITEDEEIEDLCLDYDFRDFY